MLWRWSFPWAALATVLMLLAPPTEAQSLQGVTGPLILPVTEGKGPSEHITGFKIAPDAAKHRLRDDDVGQLGQALISNSGEARREAELNLGIQILGDTQGSFGALGTLAEHALWMDQFSDINGAMNNIGLVLALAQVARDGWNGNDSAALTGGIKAWMNYFVGRFGTGAMQIGSVAVFVVDVTLREWQSGLSEIAHDLWVCHYKAWYQEHPRKTSEWIDKAWKLYLASEKGGKQAYADYVDAMLNEWVHKAFLDPQIATYGDCGTSSFGGRAYIEQKIEAEHKLLLQQMFAKKVMPEIGERAWMRTLRAQVKEAETHLMPRLNRTVTLEITAYGYPAGTIATMPLPAGGEWKAKLRDDGTRKAKITRFAILKAGFPDTVRIDGPNGPEERKLILTEDRLVAMFGTPITPVVTRYSLTEGAGSCTIKRIHDDGSVNEEQTADSRHPDKDVDFAILGNGSWVFGQYSLGSGWQVASPGVGQGENISFGAPYFDRISGLHGCSVGFLQDDKLAAGRCRITRYDEKRVSATTRIQRSCTADATIELSGIFASVISGKMTYYPMDGAEGQMILQVLKSSMSKGLVGGMPAIPDAPMFPGASALPPIPGVNK